MKGVVMNHMERRSFLRSAGMVSAGCFFASSHIVTAADENDTNITAYPDIPRIDVHTHVPGDAEAIGNYLGMRDILKEKHGADLAMWFSLGGSRSRNPDCEAVLETSRGRILSCISEYSPHDGLSHPPEELKGWLDKGYIGYKIWAGPPHRRMKPGQEGYPYIDNPVHIPTFEMMEDIGMVCASMHIADPNGPWDHRTEWLPDPVEYWHQINAFRNLLVRHPKLVVVAAHAMWAICQDAQIDYLRYMLAKFPSLNIDLAATFQYYHLVTRDNLRSFMIEYQDRILFGTDAGRWTAENNESYARRYFQCFRILETDAVVPGGFFDQVETEGLDLPWEVLEKIYWRNAARIYPRVEEQLAKLGYDVG